MGRGEDPNRSGEARAGIPVVKHDTVWLIWLLFYCCLWANVFVMNSWTDVVIWLPAPTAGIVMALCSLKKDGDIRYELELLVEDPEERRRILDAMQL